MTMAQARSSEWTAPALPALDPALRLALRQAVSGKAKPPGSLVSAYPSAITAAMVGMFLSGRAPPWAQRRCVGPWWSTASSPPRRR